MNILQVNKLYHPVIGGIETVAKNIAELLNNSNEYIVDVLACQIKGHRATETINDVKVFRAASFGKKMGMPISLDFFSLFFKMYLSKQFTNNLFSTISIKLKGDYCFSIKTALRITELIK